MTAGRGLGPVRWYRSFYWRIGVSFALLLVLVILAQSAMFSMRIARGGAFTGVASPNVRAATLAADLGRAVSTTPDLDVTRWLQDDPARTRSQVFVVMSDGRTASTSSIPVPDDLLQAARLVLGGPSADAPGAVGSAGPTVSAPINVDGALRGLVLLPPPRMGPWRDVARWATLPGTLLLVLAAALAAVLTFLPARRRLAALEAATARLADGDLSARAPEGGADEIAHVAAGFNRMATELGAREAALQASDRLRRQMLADVSHELKTPLTAMRGYVETLQLFDERVAPEQRARYHDMLVRETGRLERLVAELVELGRHEHGVSALQVRVFGVDRLFGHVVARHHQPAQALEIALAVEVGSDADQVSGDPDRLEQVIDNLVGNALRHTPAGGRVLLRATREGHAAVLEVIDSGAGIAPEHLPHVFDRFYKVDPSRAAASAGSGLGLSIARAIVERHGGRLDVESRPGRTVFRAVLPQEA